MAEKKRSRSAATGKMVSAAEAKARPGETVQESRKNDGLAARVALIEQVLDEAGGPLSVLYRRRKRGLTD
jgi:hypothetical protein